jgi:hypothetical protein
MSEETNTLDGLISQGVCVGAAQMVHLVMQHFVQVWLTQVTAYGG